MVKWVASVFVLAAMSIRGIDGLQMYDLTLSACGIMLWLWVSISVERSSVDSTQRSWSNVFIEKFSTKPLHLKQTVL